MNERAKRSIERYLTKLAVFLCCLVPALILGRNVVINDLGANPLEAVTHATGIWALRFLLLTLAITPIRRLTGWIWLQAYRRLLGLYAFFYACLHFLTWIWLDQGLRWAAILEDITERPYVTVGFAAFLILVPLAVTSTKAMMRRLGRRWRALHRLVYLSVILALLHFAWLVKADLVEPLVYGGIFGALTLLRMPFVQRRISFQGYQSSHAYSRNG